MEKSREFFTLNPLQPNSVTHFWVVGKKVCAGGASACPHQDRLTLLATQKQLLGSMGRHLKWTTMRCHAVCVCIFMYVFICIYICIFICMYSDTGVYIYIYIYCMYSDTDIIQLSIIPCNTWWCWRDLYSPATVKCFCRCHMAYANKMTPTAPLIFRAPFPPTEAPSVTWRSRQFCSDAWCKTLRLCTPHGCCAARGPRSRRIAGDR